MNRIFVLPLKTRYSSMNVLGLWAYGMGKRVKKNHGKLSIIVRVDSTKTTPFMWVFGWKIYESCVPSIETLLQNAKSFS